uniref:HECT domain-containing protein n=1 Tax=Amphimedon queenslandica TaxID=400682 RepID=A0A1X7T2C6_AMPQE
MTSSEVKEAVLSAFSDLAVDQFKYLKALQNNHLQLVDNQELNGDSLIGLCGGGSLYIVEDFDVSLTEYEPPCSNEFEDRPNNDHKETEQLKMEPDIILQEEDDHSDSQASLTHGPVLFVENNSGTFDPVPIYGQSEPVKYCVPEEPFESVLSSAMSECDKFMCSLTLTDGSYTVSRERIYHNVLELYSSDAIISHYPVTMEFKGELALDAGGVKRDVFATFFEEMYRTLFDGSSLVTPSVRPGYVLLFHAWQLFFAMTIIRAVFQTIS